MKKYPLKNIHELFKLQSSPLSKVVQRSFYSKMESKDSVASVEYMLFKSKEHRVVCEKLSSVCSFMSSSKFSSLLIKQQYLFQQVTLLLLDRLYCISVHKATAWYGYVTHSGLLALTLYLASFWSPSLELFLFTT